MEAGKPSSSRHTTKQGEVRDVIIITKVLFYRPAGHVCDMATSPSEKGRGSA
jgi:hypothetical protein